MDNSEDDLYKRFNVEKTKIAEQIGSMKSKNELMSMRAKVNALIKQVQNNVGTIAAHDMKYYTNEINILNDLIDKKQEGLQPKFSFKNRSFKLGANKQAKLDKHVETNTALWHELEAKNQKVYNGLEGVYLNIELDKEKKDGTNQHIHVKNVTKSLIRITGGNCMSVHLEDCSNVLVWADIKGPLIMRRVTKFLVSGMCHQLRVHSATDGDVGFNVQSKEIVIEKCQQIRVYLCGEIKVNDFSSPNQEVENPNYKYIKEDLSMQWLEQGINKSIEEELEKLSSF